MRIQDFLVTQGAAMLLVIVLVGIAVIAAVMESFFTVEQRTTAVVQRLGKFIREAGPGFHFKVPFIDRVIGPIRYAAP